MDNNKKLSIVRLTVGGAVALCLITLAVMFLYFTGLCVATPQGFDTEHSGTGLSIVSYSGDEETLIVPDYIGSKPVVKISEKAFYGNKTVKKAILPDTIKTVGNSAFANCTALKQVEFKSEYTTMGNSVFENSSVQEVKLPSKLRKITDNMFKNCKSVTKVTFPDNLMGIGNSAFQGCTSIKSMIIGGDVKKIGKNAFADCGENFRLSSTIGSETEKYALENTIDYTPCNDYYEVYNVYPLYTGSNRLNSQTVSEGRRGVLSYTPSKTGYYRVSVEESGVSLKITSVLRSARLTTIRNSRNDYMAYFEGGSQYLMPVSTTETTDYVINIQPVSKALVNTYKKAENLLNGKGSISLVAGTPLKTDHYSSAETVAEVSTTTTLTKVKDYYVESPNSVWYQIETNSNGSKQSRWFKA